MILVRAKYEKQCYECFIKNIENAVFILNHITFEIKDGYLLENEKIRFEKRIRIKLNSIYRIFDKRNYEFFLLNFLEMDENSFLFINYGYKRKVMIGNSTDCDIQIKPILKGLENVKLKIESVDGKIHVINESKNKNVFLNGSIFMSSDAELFSCITFDKYRVFILDRAIRINGDLIINNPSNNLLVHDGKIKEVKHFIPSRTFFEEVQMTHLNIEAPKAEMIESESGFNITSLSPLIFIFSSLIIGLNSQRREGMFFVYPIAMFVSMLILPLFQKKMIKKKKLKKRKEYEILYLDYLREMNEKMESIKDQQKAFLNQNFPTAAQCVSKLKKIETGCMSRSAFDSLEIRIGKGTIHSYLEISYENIRHDQRKEALFIAYDACCRNSLNLEGSPILCDLNHGLTIIADKQKQISFAQDIILQCIHSYDPNTLLIILVCDKNQCEYFKFIYNSFHIWYQNIFRFILCDALDIQKGIYYLKKIQNKRKIAFILNGLDFKVSDVTVVRFVKSVSEVAKNAIQIVDFLNKREQFWQGNKVIYFENELNETKGINSLKKVLANLCFQTDFEKEIPEIIDYFSINSSINKLNSILSQWENNKIEESLMIPLGMKENNQILYFDIHEKYHGPHGLIAGMTGSGKTQFILQMILTYASSYPCDLLSILLFDFKGGDLSGALYNERFKLPHIAGVCTNLNHKDIERVKKSLEYELIIRQNLMNEAKAILKQGSMNIYEYQKAYKMNKLKKPCSHLLLIVDEFAELKMHVPSFMDYLIQIARIGRSLGIHLILSTQKPAGIVNEQIWSNSRFKICMKVQNAQDSMEMIRSNQAALIRVAGRFILETGYEEELVQAQSPFLYFDEHKFDDSSKIEILNMQGEVVLKKEEHRKENGKTQFEISVNNLIEASKLSDKKSRLCWLEPLPEKIEIDYDIPMMIAKLDDPSFQRYIPYCFDFNKSILVYGREIINLIEIILWQMKKWFKNKHILLISDSQKTIKVFQEYPDIFILSMNDLENIEANLEYVLYSDEEFFLIFDQCDKWIQDLSFRQKILNLKRKLESQNSLLFLAVSSLKDCSYNFLHAFESKIMMNRFDKNEIIQFFDQRILIEPKDCENRALILFKERILEGQICYSEQKIMTESKDCFWIDLNKDLDSENYVNHDISYPFIPVGFNAKYKVESYLDCSVDQLVLSEDKELINVFFEQWISILNHISDIHIEIVENESIRKVKISKGDLESTIKFAYKDFHQINPLYNGLWIGKGFMNQRTLKTNQANRNQINFNQGLLIKNGKEEVIYPLRKGK